MTSKTAFTKALNALSSEELIHLDDLRKWIAAADLKTLGVLHVLLSHVWARITPPPSMEETCDIYRRYYLACIVKNPRSSDFMDNRYEAAWSMEKWFRYLVTKLPETSAVLKTTVAAITDLYLSSKESIQLAIVNGFLEHIFETPDLRKFFEHWQAEPVLAEAYKWALLWGKDHETANVVNW